MSPTGVLIASKIPRFPPGEVVRVSCPQTSDGGTLWFVRGRSLPGPLWMCGRDTPGGVVKPGTERGALRRCGHPDHRGAANEGDTVPLQEREWLPRTPHRRVEHAPEEDLPQRQGELSRPLHITPTLKKSRPRQLPLGVPIRGRALCLVMKMSGWKLVVIVSRRFIRGMFLPLGTEFYSD